MKRVCSNGIHIITYIALHISRYFYISTKKKSPIGEIFFYISIYIYYIQYNILYVIYCMYMLIYCLY